VSDPACGFTLPSREGWTSYEEGDFTILLPAEYRRVPVQGIDSRVGRWEAAGKQVSYDLGAYSNTLQRDEVNPLPELSVCQESDGAQPRIVRYSPPEGGYAVGAH